MQIPFRLAGRFRYALLPLAALIGLAGCGGSDNDNGQGPAQAAVSGITKIVVDAASSEAVTFGGKTFGDVGAYQKIRGAATGQLDPNDPKNAVIADIALAPRNASGMVEYSMDF